MKRGRIFFYLAVLIILMLIVVFVVYTKFMGGGTPATAKTTPVVPPTAQVEVVKVVVVTQKVARGQVFDASVLNMIPIQRQLYIDTMFTKVDDVVGKRAKFDLDTGIPLTQNMVTDTAAGLSTSGSDWALMVPKGMVSISIPISRLSSISFAPQRGDHVNLIVTMLFVELDPDFQTSLPDYTGNVLTPGGNLLLGPNYDKGAEVSTASLVSNDTLKALAAQVSSGSSPLGRGYTDPTFNQTMYLLPSEAQRPRLVSQTLIQNITVLQVGDFEKKSAEQAQAEEAKSASATTTPNPNAPANAAGPSNQPTPTPTAPPPAPDVITLIVTPQDAVTLNYLLYSGAQITLVGRGANDDSRVQTEAVTLQFLLDQYNIPIPVKLPYGMEPRVDEIVAPVLVNDKPTPKP